MHVQKNREVHFRNNIRKSLFIYSVLLLTSSSIELIASLHLVTIARYLYYLVII